MKCHEARRHLDLFMDGELSVPENMKVLEHLNLCAGCAGVYEGEKTLRAELKSDFGSERAPAALADRLSKALAPSVPPAVRRPRWGLAAAAAFFVTLLASIVFTPPAELPTALASEVVRRHEETRGGFCGDRDGDTCCLCADCAPEGIRKLERTFEERLDYEACTHDFRSTGYRFSGGAVWSRGGRRVAWTVQMDDAGRVLSHAVIPTPVEMGPNPFEVREGSRRVIFKPRAPGVTCVFVFDSDAEAARFRQILGLR